MEQELLTQKLNELTENKFDFTLKSALLKKSADFCMIEIFYKDGVMLDSETRKQLEEEIKRILPQGIKYEVNFVKNFISDERIAQEFKIFMEQKFPSIVSRLDGVEQIENQFKIKLVIDERLIDKAIEKNFKKVFNDYFETKFEGFKFDIEISQEILVTDDNKNIKKWAGIDAEDELKMSQLRTIEVFEKTVLVGDEIEQNASYIVDKLSPEENVVLCGKIRGIHDVVIKTKTKKDSDEIKAGYQKKLFKWELEGFTGSISCVYFSTKETQPKLMTLEDGASVILSGNVEDDKFNHGVTFSVKNISLCKLPENFEEKIIYKKERPYYEFVEPEKIVTYKQDDLMSFMHEEEVPEFLRGKTYVCYDFETTGLHYESGDKIIEIGAVKIENGKITERFMSYVDPERKIPAESTAISGITNEDVAGAPKDYQVLQDFYKFTRGAILTGYNVLNFDNVFLFGQGKKCRWNFTENKTEDVYRYAQKYVHGVKNYRLGTIAEKLGVVLDNAHRAVYDALATAEVFIKIAENMK
ncbi:MAG: 3'-5' exoribonuclease [Clostridia bacterium]|nr:3'-5' exoribonuclease [Clostridia bacterium]